MHITLGRWEGKWKKRWWVLLVFVGWVAFQKQRITKKWWDLNFVARHGVLALPYKTFLVSISKYLPPLNSRRNCYRPCVVTHSGNPVHTKTSQTDGVCLMPQWPFGDRNESVAVSKKKVRLPLLQRKVSLRLLEKIKDFHSAPLALLALASYEFFEHHMHAN